jgi:hypothetical protein
VVEAAASRLTVVVDLSVVVLAALSPSPLLQEPSANAPIAMSTTTSEPFFRIAAPPFRDLTMG